jgi:hypothetical protein
MTTYETRRSNMDSPIMERLTLLTNDAIAMGGGHPWRYAGLSAYGKSNVEGVTSARPCTPVVVER